MLPPFLVLNKNIKSTFYIIYNRIISYSLQLQLVSFKLCLNYILFILSTLTISTHTYILTYAHLHTRTLTYLYNLTIQAYYTLHTHKLYIYAYTLFTSTLSSLSPLADSLRF